MPIEIHADYEDLNPSQAKFLDSRARVALISGGFGSGKTLALALKIMQLKSENGPTPGLILAHNWRALWSVTLKRFQSICIDMMPARYRPRVRDKNNTCVLDFGDGHPVYLRSAQDPGTYDGLDVGWVVGDEIRHWSKAAYDVALGRARLKCAVPQCAFASTPSMGWMADEFNNRNETERELIVAPTIENERNLAPGFIDNLRLSYSPRMQEAVIDGKFTVLEGSVYEQFDSDILKPSNPWGIDYDYKAHPNSKTILAIDPGYRNSAWLLFHETKPMEWVCFWQMAAESMSTGAGVQVINGLGINIDECWFDPAADNTQQALAIDDITMLRGLNFRGGKQNLKFITGPFRAIDFGVDKVRVTLGDPMRNQPVRLKFARSIVTQERGKKRGILKDLASYRYPDAKEGRGASSTPVKDGVSDHGADAIRYMVCGMWLTTPLKNIDKELVLSQRQGWKAA